MVDFDALKQAMIDLEDEKVYTIIETINNKNDAKLAIEQLESALVEVGIKFEACEYFMGDLIFSGKVMKNTVRMLTPFLASTEQNSVEGKVLLCTPAGDLHDIGKSLVKAYLEAEGIEVIDMGVNVDPQEIVQCAIQNEVKIIALSGVLTYTIKSMRDTVELINHFGLREHIKIIVGGACINERTFSNTNADGWTVDAPECAKLCRRLLKNKI